MFGMTETSGVATMVRDTDPEHCKLTAGRVIPYMEVKLLDQHPSLLHSFALFTLHIFFICQILAEFEATV